MISPFLRHRRAQKSIRDQRIIGEFPAPHNRGKYLVNREPCAICRECERGGLGCRFHRHILVGRRWMVGAGARSEGAILLKEQIEICTFWEDNCDDGRIAPL